MKGMIKKLTMLHIVLILVFVISLGVGAYFLRSARQAEAKQPDMQNQIKLANLKLATAKEQNNVDVLKQKLTELQSIIDRSKPLFPAKPATVQIGKLIVDSADRLGLTLLELSPNPNAGTETIKRDPKLAGSKYNKAQFGVKVEGYLGPINSLIGDIEGAAFATLIVDEITITRLEEEDEDEDEERLSELWDADFTIFTLYQETK